MSHLNKMHTVTVELVKKVEAADDFSYAFAGRLPSGTLLQNDQTVIYFYKGFVSVQVNDDEEGRNIAGKQMTVGELDAFVSAMRPGIDAYVKLDSLLLIEWGKNWDLNAYNQDVKDALYVLRDNISMYLFPPTEPVSAHNEGNIYSCADAGAYEAEKELMGEYFAPVGSLVGEEGVDAWDDALDYAEQFDAKLSKTMVLGLMSHPESAYEMYLLYVIKEALVDHDVFMSVLSDVFFEKGGV